MLARDLDHCARCGDPVAEGTTLCTCGKATRWMSFADRTKYEVEQWRNHKKRQAEAKV